MAFIHSIFDHISFYLYLSRFFSKPNFCTVCVFSFSFRLFWQRRIKCISFIFDVVVILTGRFSLIVSLIRSHSLWLFGSCVPNYLTDRRIKSVSRIWLLVLLIFEFRIGIIILFFVDIFSSKIVSKS